MNDARRAVYILDPVAINEVKTRASLTISNHEDEYVLFVKGRIVDKDYDIQRLVRRALKKYKPDEIYITNARRPRKLNTIGF